MLNDYPTREPALLEAIWNQTVALKFNMASDKQTGALLRSLAATKPGGRFLELGTGTGLSACWLLDGMDAGATLLTVDSDPAVLAVAEAYLGTDPRVTIRHADGTAVLDELPERSLDFIFADAWPGKYHHLDEALARLKSGGIYFIDDLLPQPNWPEGHAAKAEKLVETLDNRPDLVLTKLAWSTGLLIGTKKSS
jgi:predicted O-methyltransferase YrrM